jgi:hypothetical protein
VGADKIRAKFGDIRCRKVLPGPGNGPDGPPSRRGKFQSANCENLPELGNRRKQRRELQI